MQEIRYKEICDHLDPCIESLLNIIRRYLQANQASVMVGAGFSKNAIFAPGVMMKDWNGLGKDFYEQLYAKSPQPKDLEFKSPVRFASQLASYTSHIELDKIISNSLPDLSVAPGELHHKLMNLPWRDVFTTNYDTLLERTRSQWVRHYDIVTNRDTLIYSKSPRIIKLHGSFPDQHPFIITEEDFRTYPNKHPEFVNTVRQSLIENLFCLIGFSGDDENFLSWIGWLRDVIGKESVMCYHITYSEDKHDSEASLMQERGITPINLKRLPLNANEGYAEALDFFLTYVKPQDNYDGKEWSGSLGESPYQDLVADIQLMKRIRESYPGWPFLPANRLQDFEDIETKLPYIGDKFATLDDKQKFNFAQEIVWRIKISYSPLVFSWIVEYIEKLIEMKSVQDKEILDLSLMLLTAYRKGGDYDKFRELDEQLKSVNPSDFGQSIHVYLYEKALLYASTLDLISLKRLMDVWSVSAEDTVPALWKANILTFMGERNEAKVLLEEALRYVSSLFGASINIRRSMLLDVLQTSLNCISGHIDGGASSNSLYISCANKLRIDLSKYEKTGKQGTRVIHTFNVGRKQKSWHSGVAGLYGDYIYPYRYVTMREQIGLPFGTTEYGIDIELSKLFFTPLVKYESAYIIGCTIRSINLDIVKEVFSREVVHNLNIRDDEIFKKSSAFDVFKNPQTKTEERIRENVLMPLFCRMCIRFSQPTIREIFDVVLNYYRIHRRRYDITREELRIIYDCSDEQSREYMLQKCLEMPMSDNIMPWELIIPECLSREVVISDQTVQTLVSKISESVGDKDRTLWRIYKVWKWLSEKQKELIRSTIINWRKGRNDTHAIRTYELITSVNDEKEYVRSMCEQEVVALEHSRWNKNEDPNNRDEITNALFSLKCLSEEIEPEQLERVYRALVNIVQDVYQQRGDFSYTGFIMNDQDYYLMEFNRYFHCFIRKTSPRMLDFPKTMKLLYDQLSILDDNNTPLLELRLRLVPYDVLTEDQKIEAQINKRLYSKLQPAKDDGALALTYALRYNDGCIKAFQSMISYMKKTQEESLILYLQYCFDILSVPKYEVYAQKCNTMLHEMLEFSKDKEISYDFRADIRYYTARIVGLMRNMDIRNKSALREWDEWFQNSDDDTDVKNGLEQGELIYHNRIDKLL